MRQPAFDMSTTAGSIEGLMEASELNRTTDTNQDVRQEHHAGAIQPGVWAILQGLLNTPALNGKEVYVKSYDEQADVWTIRLSTDEEARAKAENLQVVLLQQGATAMLHGLTAQQDKNGQYVFLDLHLPSDNCWIVRLSTPDGESTFRVKAENLRAAPALVTTNTSSGQTPLAEETADQLVFQPGMRAKLQGLTKAPELNGMEVIVEGVHEENGRWAVLIGQERMGVKAENLLMIP